MYTESNLQESFAEILKTDGFLKESASCAVVVSYLKRVDLFDDIMSRDGAEKRFKEILDKCAHTKLIAQAVKRSLKDVHHMLKAFGLCSLSVTITSCRPVCLQTFFENDFSI